LRSLAEGAPKTKKRKLDPSEADEKPQKQARTEEGEADGDESGEDGDEPKEDPDHVDEPEDLDQEPAPEDLFDEDDDEDPTDPFEAHFANPDMKVVTPRLKAIKQEDWQIRRINSAPWRLFFNAPYTPDAGDVPLPKAITGPKDLRLKKKLAENISEKWTEFNDTEKLLAPLVFNHYDTLFCERTISNSSALRRMACLHALNHVFKTRDRVIKNNARLSHYEGSEELELRDQGYTRPKVLVLLPTRNSCVKMVEMLTAICAPDQQENRKRFDESYIDKDAKFGADKPADFKDLFEGNDDDMFRLGVKFTRKTVKYFSQFYNSDILFASPLGLRMAMGSEEEKIKKQDHDFLSSIELVIVDQADALLMQNWEHVEYIFEHLNKQPKDSHGCDFSRVREWYLDDDSKYFRQTLIFSAFNTPELAELFRTECHSWEGKVRVQREYPGAMLQMLQGHKTKQTFSRFEASSIQDDPDARFAYFTKAILPTLLKNHGKDAAGTLVFIPSYLDFVRVRNYFANDPALGSLSFGTVSEYADVPEASRARSHFLTGRHRVLLYTERAHHFRRYNIKGVKRVLMYGLPDNPIFYQEIAGDYLRSSEAAMKLEPGQGSVRVMFSKYDVFKLERIVGSQRVGRMIHDRGDTFEFL
jgi:U3 small nucleolar RNA-associated protein 25